jgi:hypothetical protein
MPYQIVCKRFLKPPAKRLQKSFTHNLVWHLNQSLITLSSDFASNLESQDEKYGKKM